MASPEDLASPTAQSLQERLTSVETAVTDIGEDIRQLHQSMAELHQEILSVLGPGERAQADTPANALPRLEWHAV